MANNPAIVLNPPTIVPFGDGDYTGANGANGGTKPPGSIKGFAGRHHFWRIPRITPATAERPSVNPARGKLIVYINGINTPRTSHAYTVKLVSVVSGAEVIGIYNQSGDGVEGSIFRDLVQCLGDKMGLSNNPATNTLARAVYDACTNETHLNIVAHSQGGIITSRGIRQGIGMLLDYYGRRNRHVATLIEKVERRRGFWENVGRGIIGTDDADRMALNIALRTHILPGVETRLHDYVSAQTFGGAGRFYPDGPLYRHVYNFWDPVPNLFGQGDIMTGPGRDGRVETVNRNSGSRVPDFDDHSMDLVYLQNSEHYIDRNGRKVDSGYIPIDIRMVRTR